MPLVVPGMQSKEGGSGNEKTADWMNKLMGKKIGEGNDETVCFSFFFNLPFFSPLCFGFLHPSPLPLDFQFKKRVFTTLGGKL